MNPGDEKKLKDLTDRLMAMSPEPPPFPEETVVTSSGKQARRPSPFLVFAGAAAAVLLAIGIPFLFFDNEPPVAVPDTSTTSTTTTVGETTTTTTPGETTTTTEDGQIPANGEAIVYLATTPGNSFTGNPALVAFATPAFTGPDSDLTLYALQLLAPVDVPIAAPDGYFNAVPEGVEIYSARIAEGAPNALILEMSETFLDGSGTGLLGDFTMLNQLIYTATQEPGIDEVQFIVNNQPVTQFGTEGLDLGGSVNRETFRDEIALIDVTQPVLPDQDGNVVVEGISNTFEAALTLRVLDAGGSVVYEEPGQATSGSGTWGQYRFEVDPSVLGEGSMVQLVEYSAKDGAPTNVITIPYNNGMLWDFSGGFTN